MNRRIVGLLIGLTIGVIWVGFGFFQLLVILILALIGWVIAALTGNEDDVAALKNSIDSITTSKKKKR